MTKIIVPLETEEQKTLVKYLQLKKLFYFSIPNGAVLKGSKLQRAIQMAKLKKEGFIVGSSDIVVMLPKKILFIELKRQKGSATSQEQKDFIKKVDTFPYAIGAICRGAKIAIDFIEENL